MGKFASFVRQCVEAEDEDAYPLYDKARPWARLVKIAGQMIIGVATAVIVVVEIVMRSGLLVDNSKALGGSVVNADTLTAEVFAITAVGLAAAAAFELAYTLFTPGPDEAIDPLLLGVSSTFLFLASKTDHLDWQFGFSAVLIVVALFGLFRLQESFRKRYPDKKGKETAPGGGHQPEDAGTPEETAGSPVGRP
jgi:hypothetical protein